MNPKNILSRLFALLLIFSSLGIFILPANATSKLTLNCSSLVLVKGKTTTLKASGVNSKVKWSSSNKAVAKVSSSGKITALKPGACTITASSGRQKKTCTVKVNSTFGVSSTAITINGNASKHLTLTFTKSGTVSAQVEDSSIIDCKLGKKQNNQKNTLIVTGKKNGKTTIVLTNNKNKEKLRVAVTVTSIQSDSTTTSGDVSSPKASVIAQYRNTVTKSKYMMHALGGVNKVYSYTNSIDALKLAYAEGYRLFEVDVSFTSDNQLVLAHQSANGTWSKVDWEQRLGQPYDQNHPLASYGEFMKFVIQGKFKATSFAELVNYMETHTDMFVLLDVGSRNAEQSRSIYQAIVNTVGKRDSILWHFIAGGHSIAAMKAVQSVYSFPLYNLYFADESVRDTALKTPKAFLNYCKKNGILSFSTSTKNYTKELNDPDVISYVFTVDNQKTAQQFFDAGVDVVGTNFLRN